MNPLDDEEDELTLDISSFLPTAEEPAAQEEIIPEYEGVEDFIVQAPADTSPIMNVEGDISQFLPTVETAPLQAPVEKKSLTADDIISDPKRMGIVRNYMSIRRGNQWLEADPRETYDAYINTMRGFATNEIDTLSEARALWNADDTQKSTMGQAYQLFEELGSFATNDGILGAVDGLYDYGAEILTSPSTWLGVGVGKLATAGAGAVAKQAVIKTAMAEARKLAAAQALKSGATQSVALTAGRTAAKKIAADASTRVAVKEVVAATAADSGMSVFQDYMYQDTLINSGAQDEYSVLQSTLAGTLGVVAGGVSAIPLLTRNGRTMRGADKAILQAKKEESKRVAEKIAPEMQKSITLLQEEMIDWKKAVADGKTLTKDSHALRNKVVETLLSPDHPASLVTAMKNAGMKMDPEEGFTHQAISFATNLPPKNINELDQQLMDSVGFRYTEMLDMLASSVSEAGGTLNLASQASKQFSSLITARALSDKVIVAAKDAPSSVVSIDGLKYVQSLWRRALVSSPATTAANVAGWGAASGARGLAEVFHGGALGTAGMATKLAKPLGFKGAAKFSDEAMDKSRALMKAQTFKLQTLLHPYETKEAFDTLLKQTDEAYNKQLMAQGFSGVDMDSAARYNMNPDNPLIKGTERVAHNAAVLSLMKVQDHYTKAQTFLNSMNRQLLESGNKGGIMDVLDRGDLSGISDDMWNKALKESLEDSFSQDYTKGSSFSAKSAKLVEDLSNAPGLGFLFPFGRFMNNYLAFTLNHSPVGFVRGARGVWKGDNDAASLMVKGSVGSMAIATLAYEEGKKMEKGLAWWQEEGDTGTVYDRTNLAPLSFYKVAGRVAYLKATGQEVSKDLKDDLILQMGPIALTKEADTGITALNQFILSVLNPETLESEGRDTWDMVGAGMGIIGGDVMSGFLRPFEAANIMVGQGENIDKNVDRRQLRGTEATVSNTLKYVDVLFAKLEGTLEGKDATMDDLGPDKHSATRPDRLRADNPVGKLVGVRAMGPQTASERMLAGANLQPWKIDERTKVPEWDALVNDKVFPLIEYHADKLIRSDSWKNASQSVRARLVKNVVNNAKKDTRDFVSSTPSGRGPALDALRKLSSQPPSLRSEAKKELGITKQDHELTYYEIQRINSYIGLTKEDEKTLSGN